MMSIALPSSESKEWDATTDFENFFHSIQFLWNICHKYQLIYKFSSAFFFLLLLLFVFAFILKMLQNLGLKIFSCFPNWILHYIDHMGNDGEYFMGCGIFSQDQLFLLDISLNQPDMNFETLEFNEISIAYKF